MNEYVFDNRMNVRRRGRKRQLYVLLCFKRSHNYLCSGMTLIQRQSSQNGVLSYLAVCIVKAHPGCIRQTDIDQMRSFCNKNFWWMYYIFPFYVVVMQSGTCVSFLLKKKREQRFPYQSIFMYVKWVRKKPQNKTRKKQSVTKYKGQRKVDPCAETRGSQIFLWWFQSPNRWHLLSYNYYWTLSSSQVSFLLNPLI